MMLAPFCKGPAESQYAGCKLLVCYLTLSAPCRKTNTAMLHVDHKSAASDNSYKFLKKLAFARPRHCEDFHLSKPHAVRVIRTISVALFVMDDPVAGLKSRRPGVL